MNRMKDKFNWNSKKKVKPISNIDLRILRISFNVPLKNKKITKKNSRTFVWKPGFNTFIFIPHAFIEQLFYFFLSKHRFQYYNSIVE